MNISLQKIFYQFLGKTAMQDVRLETLYDLADKHPYFAPAQLFLYIKMQEDEHQQQKIQLQKTALYFNNANWLYHQITPKPEFIQFIGQENVEIIQPILHHVIEEELNNSVQETSTTIDNDEQVMEEVSHATVTNEEPINATEENIVESNLSITATALAVAEQTTNPVIEEALPTITTPIMQEMEEAIDVNENAEQSTTTENNEIDNKLAEIIQKQLDDFNTPVSANDEDLLIDNNPHHTVDYFESQGIKAAIETNTQDKLSSQLRKFTDWLKHIKTKNIENKEDLGTDPELENAIHGIAQNSNETREIVTETMAEVLEKQGKKDKAIQLYIKLSFLNPDKSAYFATKIQHLKGI